MSLYDTVVLERCSGLPDESKVTRNEDIVGSRGVAYSIDVVWRYRVKIPWHTVLFSAKHWKTRIKRAHINELCDIITDIPGQPRAILVTSHGVQAGALDYAKARGVDIWQLKRTNGELSLSAKAQDYVTAFGCVPFQAVLTDADEKTTTVVFDENKLIVPQDLIVFDEGKLITLETICEDSVAVHYLDGPEDLDESLRFVSVPCSYEAIFHGNSYRLTRLDIALRAERKLVDFPSPRVEALFTYLIDVVTLGERFKIAADYSATNISDGTVLKSCDACGLPLEREKMVPVNGSSFAVTLKKRRPQTVHYDGRWLVCQTCYQVAAKQGSRSLLARVMLMSDVLTRQSRNQTRRRFACRAG